MGDEVAPGRHHLASLLAEVVNVTSLMTAGLANFYTWCGEGQQQPRKDIASSSSSAHGVQVSQVRNGSSSQPCADTHTLIVRRHKTERYCAPPRVWRCIVWGA